MARRGFLLAGAALLLALVPLGPAWIKLFMIVMLAKGIAVLGVIVLMQAGQVSFGHALYFALGAYVIAFAGRSMGGGDVVTLLVAATLVSGLAGLVLGLFVVRYRYIFFGMLNLAFSMVFYSILDKFFNFTGGSDGMRVVRPKVFGYAMERAPFELTLYGMTALATLACAYAVSRYLRSPPGEMLRAIKSNETRLEYIGVSAKTVLLAGYVISALLCGLGGGLTAIVQGLATPEYAFWTRSGEMVFIAILGGSGHVAGAFAGALIFEGLRAAATIFFSDAWQLILGTTLLLIVIYAPEGVCGLFARYFARPARRAAEPAA